jgi:hypothetical protein
MSANALVLCYIERYSARDVAPFVESLRATGYAGDVVFFTYDVDDDCGRLFAENDVRQIHVSRLDMRRRIRIPDWLARVLGMSSKSLIPDRAINIRLSRLFRRLNLGKTWLAWTAAKVLWHCQAARFLYFQEFLEGNPQYESVLIADARDVVFQRDPFAFDMSDRWYIFEEYPATPLGQQRENAGWVRSLYGPAVLDQLSNFPVLCVGLLLGRRRSLVRSLHTINEEIITNHIGWSTDQGVPNYFVRDGRLPEAEVVPYGSGPAMHVGIAPRESIRTDPQGRVLNAEGEVCNIIHQYDRHPDLRATLWGDGERSFQEAAVAG